MPRCDRCGEAGLAYKEFKKEGLYSEWRWVLWGETEAHFLSCSNPEKPVPVPPATVEVSEMSKLQTELSGDDLGVILLAMIVAILIITL